MFKMINTIANGIISSVEAYEIWLDEQVSKLEQGSVLALQRASLKDETLLVEQRLKLAKAEYEYTSYIAKVAGQVDDDIEDFNEFPDEDDYIDVEDFKVF